VQPVGDFSAAAAAAAAAAVAAAAAAMAALAKQASPAAAVEPGQPAMAAVAVAAQLGAEPGRMAAAVLSGESCRQLSRKSARRPTRSDSEDVPAQGLMQAGAPAHRRWLRLG
jgi:branched-subunit amino acid ABC-type transport system permease component